jgi:hypothetical protein
MGSPREEVTSRDLRRRQPRSQADKERGRGQYCSARNLLALVCGAEAARDGNADVAATARDPPASRHGRRKRPDVTVADVSGVKYFERLVPLLEPLHDVGCERDRAGNRELHYDQLCVLLLLGLFHPVVDGLRGLQQASELAKIQKRLKLGRASLESFSEASRVFRFFKQILGCRHLYFHSQNGIELQAYCAIIACMLLCLWTGRKPTKRTYEMVC